jgi:hypothetical protein
MREKILAKLKEKFSGLSSTLLGQIADKLATTVTEESAIEGAVGELDKLPISLTDYANLLQKEGDRRVTEAEKKWKETNPGQTPPKTEPAKTNPPADEMPSWAKALADEVKTLRQEKAQSTFRSKVAEKLKGKVPDKFYAKLPLPEKEEDLDQFISDIESDWTEIKQGDNNAGLSGTPTPAGGIGAPKSTNVDKDIEAWATAGSETKK